MALPHVGAVQELLVKFRRRAYVHAAWVPRTDLVRAAALALRTYGDAPL
jgi:hypothetical protein